MVMDVPAHDDPRVQITIPVPVKGRKQPLLLKVPRFDFIDEDTYDAIVTGIDAIDKTLPQRKATRLVVLAYLKPCVPAKDYAVCETLMVGQLNAILQNWNDASNITLGEYLASAASLTGNTEAPSDTTSSPEGTVASISGAA